MIIADRFQLNNKINSGSFGQIHLALDLKTKQTVAVKMEALNSKHPQLEYEAKLLAYLTDQIDARSFGFPRLYFYGSFDRSHVMIMDLLGPSLQQLFQKCNKKFDLKTVVMIGVQLIQRLKFLHKKKFIHRDIKPQNFLLGMNQHCGTVFMIDLGLSKKYIQKNGDHIPYRDDRSLKGTPRYTSLNSHLGIQQSRRDDLESIIYMLIYFLKGQLPWQNLKQDANYDRYEKILEKKLSVSIENLCYGLPHQFRQLVEYTRGLHFIEEPNYDFMKNLLQQALYSTGAQILPNDLYCWEKVQDQITHSKLQNQETFNLKKSFNNPNNIHDKDSLFEKDSSQFNPFATKLDSNSKPIIKPNQKDDSFDFNPFELSKKKRGQDEIFGDFENPRDSLNKSQENPFNTRQSKVDDQNNNPFGSQYGDFGNIKVQNKERGKNESFDDPFGNFDQPDIVQL